MLDAVIIGVGCLLIGYMVGVASGIKIGITRVMTTLNIPPGYTIGAVSYRKIEK